MSRRTRSDSRRGVREQQRVTTVRFRITVMPRMAKALSVLRDGERLRRGRPAILALGAGCALAVCPQALAVVGTRATTVSVKCGSDPVAVSQGATCTITVTDSDTSGTPSPPTGKVAFTSDSQGTTSPSPCELSTAGAERSTCSVEYTPTKVGSGTQEITAAYAGDSAHAVSSGSAKLTVALRATSVSVSCGSGLVVVSQKVTCTITVSDSDAAGTPSPPTGTVGFTSDSQGTTSPSPCELSPAGAAQSTCSVEYTPTKAGKQEITGAYEGDSAHAAMSGSAELTVVARATSVSVSCGSGVVASQTATCTVTVTDSDAAGTPSAPTGMVTFASDANGAGFSLSGACTLTPLVSNTESGCSVEYMPGGSALGTHAITATYRGDSIHGTGSALGTLAVSAPAQAPSSGTTTTAVPSPAPGTAPGSPAPPKCQVRARQRWRMASGAKRRARKLQKPELLVTYTCDQNAAVRVSGVLGIVSSSHGRKSTKTINLAPVSSLAVIGKADSGIVLSLPSSAGRALRHGVRTSVTVRFTVKNANGIGVGVIRFRLFPMARA
jgi:Bacterial Ig-like domain (group 3)